MDKKPGRLFPRDYPLQLTKYAIVSLAFLALAGCARKGDIDATGGIIQVRSACPIVAIPAYTGDVTTFSAPGSTEASSIDVVATITNLRSTCDDSGAQIYTNATFTVNALRREAGPSREIVLPYFSTVVRGATTVVSKRVGQVRLVFAEGQLRASANASAASYIDKNAATLPPDILDMITRKRKAGDADAALDPMTRPEVKTAIQRTSFELLVGFNLTQDQLRYNATR